MLLNGKQLDLLESLLQENGVIDESMGFRKLEGQLSVPFRIALIHY